MAIGVMQVVIGVMRAAIGVSQAEIVVMPITIVVMRAAMLAACRQTVVVRLPAGAMGLRSGALPNPAGVFRAATGEACGSGCVVQRMAFVRPRSDGVVLTAELESPAAFRISEGRISMRALTPAILAAGLISTLSAAAEPLQYENPALHYSLTVPDGWVRMPDDVLASRGQAGGGSADVPTPVAAFQQPADSWFHVPALVITHFPEKGRRPKDLFEELTHNAGLGKNGKMAIHDDERGMVLIRELMPSSDGGQIDRVAVFKPGTEGTLHLDFYLPVGEMPAYGDPMLRGVLDSVRFEEGFAINDLAPGERAPLLEEFVTFLRTRPTTLLMFVGGVVLMIVSILRNVRRKRKG